MQYWRSALAALIATWLVWVLFNAEFQSANGLAGFWGWQFVLFGFAWFLLPLGLLLFWRWSLQLITGIAVPFTECLRTQSLAWAGRYLPGKAGFWLAKVSVKPEDGLTLRALSHSALVEQALFVAAGLLIGVALLPQGLGFLTDGSLLLSGFLRDYAVPLLESMVSRIVLVLVLIASSLVFVNWSARLLGSPDFDFRWREWLLLLAGHCALHAALGFALFPLLSIMAPESASLYGWTGVAAVLALANIAGILAFFAPAGLGVREFVIAICFANQLGMESALQLAAFLRLITFVSDLAFSGTAWVIGFILERQGRVSK